jgi:hypothetical protein
MCYWPSLPGLTSSFTVLCDGPNSSPQLHQFLKLKCQGTSTAVSPSDVPTSIAQGFYVLTSEAFSNKCFYDAMIGIYQYSGICSNGLSSAGDSGGDSNGVNKGNSNEGLTSTAQTGLGVGVGIGVGLFVLLSAFGGYWYYYKYSRGATTTGLAAQDEVTAAAAAAAAASASTVTSSRRGQGSFVSDTIPLPRTSLARDSDGNSFQQPPSRLDFGGASVPVPAKMQGSDEI